MLSNPNKQTAAEAGSKTKMVINLTTAARRIGGRNTAKVNSVKFKKPTVSDIIFRIKKEEQGTRKKSRGDGNGLVDEVTCEILSRLPARSLVRFKCVCKSWRFLVERDPYFIDLSFTRSKTRPKFFAVVENPFGKALVLTGDYLSDEGGEKAIVDINNTWEIEIDKPHGHVTWEIEIDKPHGHVVFGPLNGLFGFYHPQNFSGVRVSNVCTRETAPWMEPTFLMKYKPNSGLWRYANCQLGFDPATRKHKVICIFIECDNLHHAHGVFCEVWTVGDHLWRRIAVEDVPYNLLCHFHLILGSVCSNGSIYYNTFGFADGGFHDYNKIAVFDVGSEKFRAITIPDFILHRHGEINYGVVVPFGLLQVDARLALLCRIRGSFVELWLYDDDDHKRENCWREVVTEIRPERVTFLSSVGENQIMFKSYMYHSYNWRKKTFTRVKINGIPSAVGRLVKTAYGEDFFTESLFSLQ